MVGGRARYRFSTGIQEPQITPLTLLQHIFSVQQATEILYNKPLDKLNAKHNECQMFIALFCCW